ncbi:MAG: hypothetical protein J6Q00_05310, partial [Verrucomicrobia bacterium]|nr:hypothetical protein [Verrucomicrobiota bacterium]
MWWILPAISSFGRRKDFRILLNPADSRWGTILIPSGRVMAIFPPVMIISRSGPGFKVCQRSFYFFCILLCFKILDFFIGEIWGILMEIFEVKVPCLTRKKVYNQLVDFAHIMTKRSF